jgi:VRR-NUC domain
MTRQDVDLMAPHYLLTCTEGQFQKTLVDAAKTYGWTTVHFPAMQLNPTGFPDLILIRVGVVKFWELKRESERKKPNGGLSPKQVEWMHTLRNQGADWRMVYPSDWDETIIPELRWQ